MRIVIASAAYYPMVNGVAVFAHNLATGLAKQGHEVMVIKPSFDGKHKVLKRNGITTVSLRSIRLPVYPDQIHKVPEKKKIFGRSMPQIWYKNGIWIAPAPFSEVRRALKKFHPEVIHSQTSDPIGVAVAHYAHRYQIPLVTTGHSYPDQITGQIKGIKPVKKIADAALAAYLSNYRAQADYVTMPTEMAIEDLAGKKKREFKIPIEALSNGVDLTEFQPGEADKKIYTKYKLSKERPIVLYVGRVDPAKSIDRVIEAFEQVLKKIPEAQLVIVGDGVDMGRLKDIVKRQEIEDKVRFLGRVMMPELAEVYRAGSVFVTASETETQGIVLIEAAASGLPIVAVDAGAVKEVCRDGKNGVLCQPKDVDGIAKGIIKIISNDKISQKYREESIKISKIHDLNHTLERFVEIYQEAIDLKIHE